jgi:EpsI family protein
MGHHPLRRVSIVIALLMVTGILIHRAPGSTIIKRSHSLKQVLGEVVGWRNVGDLTLDPAVIESLDLDDYVNRSYTDGQRTVTLYIGYYHTSRKIGAAHDPLVCFLGQGWVVSKMREGKLPLDDISWMTVSYSEMAAQRQQERQFIIYWFQAYDRATSDTLSQKTVSTWQRLLNGRGDNAFVRISMPMGTLSEAECRQTIHNFIYAIYPSLMHYVRG